MQKNTAGVSTATRFRRSAWLLHGLAVLFFCTSLAGMAWLPASQELEQSCGFGLIASVVLAAWSVVLAIRALAGGEPPLWPRVLVILGLLECAFPALVLWPTVVTRPWERDGLVKLAFNLGVPVMLPVLSMGLGLAWLGASLLLRWLERRRARRKPGQPVRRPRLVWAAAFALCWLAATLLLLPAPMVVFGACVGPYLGTDTWQERTARFLAVPAGDWTAACCHWSGQGKAPTPVTRAQHFVLSCLVEHGCVSGAALRAYLDDPLFCDSGRVFDAAVRHRPEILPAYIEDLSQNRTSAGPYMQQLAAKWLIAHPPPDENDKQHAARVERMLWEPRIPAIFLETLVERGKNLPILRPAVERLALESKHPSDAIVHALNDYFRRGETSEEEDARSHLYTLWSLLRRYGDSNDTTADYLNACDNLESLLAKMEESKFPAIRRGAARILSEVLNMELRHTPSMLDTPAPGETAGERAELQALKAAAAAWAKPERIRAILSNERVERFDKRVWQRICASMPDLALKFAERVADGSHPADHFLQRGTGAAYGRLGGPERVRAMLARKEKVPQRFFRAMLDDIPPEVLREIKADLRALVDEGSDHSYAALQALSKVEDSALLARRYEELLKTPGGAHQAACTFFTIAEMDLRASAAMALLSQTTGKTRRIAANNAFLHVDGEKLARPVVRKRWVEQLRRCLDDEDLVVRRAGVGLLGKLLGIKTPATTFPNDGKGEYQYVLGHNASPEPEAAGEAGEREAMRKAAQEWLSKQPEEAAR